MVKSVNCCPRCKKLVEAKDYMNTAMIGFLKSVSSIMNCDCGYSGLSVRLPLDQYKKWINEE